MAKIGQAFIICKKNIPLLSFNYPAYGYNE